MSFYKSSIYKLSFLFSHFQKTNPKLRFFDIAANLADKSFSGYYYDKKSHDSDVDAVIERAQNEGCDRLLIVGKKKLKNFLNTIFTNKVDIFKTALIHMN